MIHYQTVVGDSNKGVMVEYVGSTLHYQSGGHKFILQRVHQEQFKEGQFSSSFQSINQATKLLFLLKLISNITLLISNNTVSELLCA